MIYHLHKLIIKVGAVKETYCFIQGVGTETYCTIHVLESDILRLFVFSCTWNGAIGFFSSTQIGDKLLEVVNHQNLFSG